MDEKTLERVREREKKREKFFCFAFFRETCCLFSFASLRHMSVRKSLESLCFLCSFFSLVYCHVVRPSHATKAIKKKRETLWAFVKVDFVFASSTTRGKREREREKRK